jgi:hypothetical protein
MFNKNQEKLNNSKKTVKQANSAYLETKEMNVAR